MHEFIFAQWFKPFFHHIWIHIHKRYVYTTMFEDMFTLHCVNVILTQKKTPQLLKIDQNGWKIQSGLFQNG